MDLLDQPQAQALLGDATVDVTDVASCAGYLEVFQLSGPIPLLEAGSHSLFAVYSGNEFFLGSTSNSHFHAVLPSGSASTKRCSTFDQMFSSDFAGVLAKSLR